MISNVSGPFRYKYYLIHLNLVPPHGQEDIQDLKSIFEVPHLREAQTYYFLDTQCKGLV